MQKLTKEQASQVFGKAWELAKEYGFNELTEDQIRALLTESQILQGKYSGKQKRLATRLIVAVNEYYGEISHGNDKEIRQA